MEKLFSYSKELIERGNVPIDELLSNSVFYPASGLDGRPIKRLNPLYPKNGICSYIYADYAIGNELLSDSQDTFLHYHIFATRDLKKSDLLKSNIYFSEFEKLFTSEEAEEYRNTILRYYNDNVRIFGKWIVYERDEDVEESFGAQRFSLLYIGGEGAATYAALYLSRNTAPSVLVDINPGIAFGGNYSCFRSILSKVINSGAQLPKYCLSGDNATPAANCLLEEYKNYELNIRG